MDIADLTAFAREWLDNLSTDLFRYVVFAVGVAGEAALVCGAVGEEKGDSAVRFQDVL